MVSVCFYQLFEIRVITPLFAYSGTYRPFYLMLFPLILSVSKFTGSRFLIVILTAFRWVFIATSTPVTVPCTWVPFFNSTVTVSWDNFIRNLKKIKMTTYRQCQLFSLIITLSGTSNIERVCNNGRGELLCFSVKLWNLDTKYTLLGRISLISVLLDNILSQNVLVEPSVIKYKFLYKIFCVKILVVQEG